MHFHQELPEKLAEKDNITLMYEKVKIFSCFPGISRENMKKIHL